MISNFQKTHILNILATLDLTAARPLDLSLNKYFRVNKNIGSKDRKKISDIIYWLVRWKGLVDAQLEKPTWKSRLELIEKNSFDALLNKKDLQDHEKVSFPKELFNDLCKRLGKEKAIAYCKATNEPGPVTVRVNTLKTTREALFLGWEGRYNISLCKESSRGITFHEKINFAELPEFKKGLFEIQDEASQLISLLVQASPGDEVLDFCAGAGGKSLAFAERLEKKGQIYLYDVRHKPLEAAKLRLKRAGIQNAQILLDSKSLNRFKNRMNWIITDVPCSGSGTWRRNPDQKWKFTKDKLASLLEMQKAIVKEALSYLHPKGSLVYSTCSIFSEENEEQIEYFLKTHDLEKKAPAFQSFPSPNEMDGFFGVVLTRRT